jgi:hypothetical protein
LAWGLLTKQSDGPQGPGIDWLLQAELTGGSEMQGQDTQKTDNVVSLFSNREKAKEASASESATSELPEDPEAFKDVMSKNAKNKERLEKERANANKSVLRSYRIKH